MKSVNLRIKLYILAFPAGVLWDRACKDVPVPGTLGRSWLWCQLLYWHVLSDEEEGAG